MSKSPHLGQFYSRWHRWVLAAWILVGGLLGLRYLCFEGPYRSVIPETRGQWIDLHVHTAGIGAGDSGCFVSPSLRDSYKFGIYLKAFGITRQELELQGDALLLDRIEQQVAQSHSIEGAVILALDGFVDAQGHLDLQRTEVYVPNSFVAREVKRHPHLLFGASIHPGRSNALEQLDWVAKEGAVLVKWIPSIMGIDPADPRWSPFYQRMKELGLPLLTHAGQERSFIHSDDDLADPERLRLPLSMGLTVIAAHVASTGDHDGESDFERLARLMGEYPNLYSEVSSLTQINKLGYLRQALIRPEFAGHLCYGSDFPLINTALVSPWFFPMNLNHRQMQDISNIPNPWDRDVALKGALGVPREVFFKTGQLIRGGGRK